MIFLILPTFLPLLFVERVVLPPPLFWMISYFEERFWSARRPFYLGLWIMVADLTPGLILISIRPLLVDTGRVNPSILPWAVVSRSFYYRWRDSILSRLGSLQILYSLVVLDILWYTLGLKFLTPMSRRAARPGNFRLERSDSRRLSALS